MKFNEKIMSIRKMKGLSQEELGMELQVSRQTISKWESGQSYPDFQRLVMQNCRSCEQKPEKLRKGRCTVFCAAAPFRLKL